MQRVYIYFILETEQILQNKYIFIEVYLKQEEDWQLDGAAIAIYINPFLTQQEYNNITLPSDKMTAMT